MNALANIPDIDPLKKPVNTLAIVPQSKKITVLGRKAYNVMLNIAQNQGIEQDIYVAPLAEIVRGIEFDSNDIEIIKKHLRSMASTIVEWHSPTTGEGPSWSVCALISHATLSKKRGQVWVEWSYAKPLKQELLEPSVFAKLSLGILSQMHTHAGIALYEICTRYKAIGRTSRQTWRWWQPVLTGQPQSDKLAKTEYRFFKRDTLKPAIAEVNAITDIEVELVEHKEGKSVGELQFLVRQKVQADLPLKSTPRPLDLSLIKLAVELGVPEDKAEELFNQFGEVALGKSLEFLKSRVAKSYPEQVRNPYRYLKALLSGQQDQSYEQSLAPLVLKEESKAVEIRSGTTLKSDPRSEWNDEWLRRKRLALAAQIRSLETAQVEEITEKLLLSMRENNTHPAVMKRLKTSGWEHPLVTNMMIDFFARSTMGEGWNVPSSEDLLAIAAEGTGT